MIVVVILGLLSSMGIIAYQHHRIRVTATAFGVDLRMHRDAIERCVFETKSYQVGAPPGQLAAILEPYIRNGRWSAPTPLGGKWVVDTQLDGIRVGVGVDGFTSSIKAVELADRLFDDGNPTTGSLRLLSSSKLIWIIE